MALAPAVIVGALGGLILGSAQFVIAMTFARRALAREMAQEGETPGLAYVAARFRLLRNWLAGLSFLAMPALGCALGLTMGSHGDAR